MFAGAYWAEREESREEAAEKVARYLAALASVHDRLSRWFLKARTRRYPLVPVGRTAAQIAGQLGVHRRDLDGAVIPELGFTLELWNGEAATLSFTVGGFNPRVVNAVVLSVGADADLPRDIWRRVLAAQASAFDPDHAVVTTVQRIVEARVASPWEVALFRYERGLGVLECA